MQLHEQPCARCTIPLVVHPEICENLLRRHAYVELTARGNRREGAHHPVGLADGAEVCCRDEGGRGIGERRQKEGG